ncbi:hypothetical protein B0H16DRAFT_1576452 [Mycena metata]|uniref:Uncharacterized protein n=1 Tax=Mycena metata TaxID=1033252 RepID=A0AAD7I6I1_9AGAR|nr:hypothetical protein B0H16DRAFT_1576452 [Mycena metata]
MPRHSSTINHHQNTSYLPQLAPLDTGSNNERGGGSCRCVGDETMNMIHQLKPTDGLVNSESTLVPRTSDFSRQSGHRAVLKTPLLFEWTHSAAAAGMPRRLVLDRPLLVPLLFERDIDLCCYSHSGSGSPVFPHFGGFSGRRRVVDILCPLLFKRPCYCHPQSGSPVCSHTRWLQRAPSRLSVPQRCDCLFIPIPGLFGWTGSPSGSVRCFEVDSDFASVSRTRVFHCHFHFIFISAFIFILPSDFHPPHLTQLTSPH